MANGNSSDLLWLGGCWAGDGWRDVLGRANHVISEAWASQNLVALRETDRRARFPFRFLPLFSKALSIGMVSLYPSSIYRMPAASQALPNSMSFTISGSVGSIGHSICFPRLPVHSKAKFSRSFPRSAHGLGRG